MPNLTLASIVLFSTVLSAPLAFDVSDVEASTPSARRSAPPIPVRALRASVGTRSLPGVRS